MPKRKGLYKKTVQLKWYKTMNQYQKAVVLGIGGFIAALIMTFAVQHINAYFILSDDNYLEETIEDVYLIGSGIEADFTPKSRENK